MTNIKIKTFVCPVRPALHPTKCRTTNHGSVLIATKTTALKKKKVPQRPVLRCQIANLFIFYGMAFSKANGSPVYTD
jgi:hypothetical protein